MLRRKQYEKAMKEKLHELEEELERLQKEVKNVESQLSAEHRSKLEDLHELKEKAQAKFHELVEAGDEAWEGAQKGLEHYWTAVGNEMKSYEGFTRKE